MKYHMYPYSNAGHAVISSLYSSHCKDVLLNLIQQVLISPHSIPSFGLTYIQTIADIDVYSNYCRYKLVSYEINHKVYCWRLMTHSS